MEYRLRNQKKVNIRVPMVKDAEGIIAIMKQADTESRFLAREPGEFTTSVDRECAIIENMLNDPDQSWFVAEYEGKLIGQCSIGLVRRVKRYRHRAEVGFVLLKEYWNLGIGGKMMEACIQWARENQVRQIELDVVSDNERAIRMYEGFGFQKTGEIPNALCYSDGTFAKEYYMIKTLD